MKGELSPLNRFWRLLKPDYKEIQNVYIYSIFNGIVNLTIPLGIQAIINLIQGGKINTSWAILVLLVTMGVGLMGLLSVFQLRIVENLQQKIFTKAALEFAYRIPRIKIEQFQKRYAPEMMNRFFDIVTIQKGLSNMLIQFSTSALQIVFGLILLSFYHPFFILFSLLLILLLGLIFKLTAKKGLETSLKESDYKYKTVHWLEEVARTTLTFKLSGNSSLPLINTDKIVNNYLTARENHFKILISQFSLMILFKVLMTFGLLAIGGILVMEQEMNIGQFVAGEIIILLLMNAAEKLIRSLETIYDVLTGLEKVGEVTDLELENNQGISLKAEKGQKGMKIETVDLSFRYSIDEKYILKNISLQIEPGELVVICGKNGSGKSTLLRVLSGLYGKAEGQVLFNETNINSFSYESIRTAIGDYLSQEQLFEGSLKENLSMGKKISLKRIQSVCRQIKLSDYIKTLPNGLETLLDPQGKRLPESLIQKILLGRAILNAQQLLLVEDNLDAIDEDERKSIIDYLRSDANQQTIIVVSKNNYFIQKADRVICLEEGKVIFNGSSDAYLNKAD